jgi:hypothetical protein
MLMITALPSPFPLIPFLPEKAITWGKNCAKATSSRGKKGGKD